MGNRKRIVYEAINGPRVLPDLLRAGSPVQCFLLKHTTAGSSACHRTATRILSRQAGAVSLPTGDILHIVEARAPGSGFGLRRGQSHSVSYSHNMIVRSPSRLRKKKSTSSALFGLGSDSGKRYEASDGGAAHNGTPSSKGAHARQRANSALTVRT